MLDPIHGFVGLTPFEKQIIDTPLFQRLGHIKQLTSAFYVFPGGQHTRKSHSIGAMHLARQYMEAILKHPQTSHLLKGITAEETIQYVTVAALLHDIAHGPYSHSWDSTVYSKIYDCHKGHDAHRHILLRYFKSYFGASYFLWEKVSMIWEEDSNDKSSASFPGLSGFKPLSDVLRVIISGPCSVDRGDFLKRDSYFCGLNYGVIDMQRIMNNCWITEKGGRFVFVYDSKVVKSMLQGLSSRIYLYEEVYFNKSVIATSILVELMISEACSVLGYEERVKNVESFIYLNDDSIFYEILTSEDPKLELARKYAKMIYERKVPRLESQKIVYEGDLTCNGRHKRGVTVLERNDKETRVLWKSSSLSRDFVSEFERCNIHISHCGVLYPFREYYETFVEDSCKSPQSYCLERVYAFP